jgi:hypothetical protein
MTAREESYLVLEKSLTNRISRQWEADINGTLNEISRLVNEGRFQDAEALCDDLSMRSVAEKNKRFMEFVGMQSVLFGASRLTRGNVSSTMFMQDDTEVPEEVERSSQALSEGLSVEGSEDVCAQARKLIAEEKVAQEEATFDVEEPSTGDVPTIEDTRTLSERRKAATDTFIRRFQSSVRGNGEAYINITSSLHTSRLGGWGFLQEAKFRGISKYQVSEQLDSRTCKVCQTMHGRVFDVGPADQKLNNWLSVDNLQQFKSIAPFPSQSASSIKSLASMQSSEIAGKGWDTPPYHPRCRGILVELGAVPVKQPVRPQAVAQPEALPAQGATVAEYELTHAEVAAIEEKYGVKIVNEFYGEGDTLSEGWRTVFGTTKPDEVYNSIFSGMTTRPGFDNSPGTGIGSITIRGQADYVEAHVRGKLYNKDNEVIGLMQRTITNEAGELTVKHDLFQLNSSVQGAGLGKQALRDSVKLYESMGVEHVKVFANIDAGGYAWARYGYVPTATDWGYVSNRARAALQNVPDDLITSAQRLEILTILSDTDPKAIWRLADIRLPSPIPGRPLGRALLEGSDWNGILDLTDPEAMKRFRNYVG